MSAKYKSPSFLLPNELNTSTNPLNTDGDPATGTGVNSLYSMDFNGSSDFIDLGKGLKSTFDAATKASVSLWFRASVISPSTAAVLFQQESVDAGDNWSFVIRFSTSGKLQTGIKVGSSFPLATYTTGLTAGDWYNVVSVYESSTLKLYLNGVKVAENLSTSSPLVTSSSNAKAIVGATAAPNRYFNGQIDEVAIFNRALNTTEIAALYDGTGSNIRPSNLIASNLNPVAYYPLGEQAQNTGYVGSGNPGNPNTLSNVWQFPNGVLQDYVMDFDGATVGDYIDAGDIPLEGVYTISFWINPEVSPSLIYFLLDKGDGSSNISVRVTQRSSNAIRFQIGSTYLESADTLTNNSWNNVILIANGSSSKIYINNGAASTGTLPTAPNTTQSLLIGTDEDKQDNYYFNGQMSNVVVWNSDQSTNRANIYNNGSPQTTYTVTPQNWWKLNATSVYTPSAPNYTTALDFGGSQNVNTNYTGLDGLSKATISLWVRPDTASANGTIFNARDGSNVGMNCQFFTSKTYLYFTGSINIISANYTPPFSDNLWVNLVIVFDGTLTGNDRIKLYANGETKVIDTYNGAIPAVLPTSSTSLKIAESFNGQVSNFAIFNSALTSSQVSTLFNFGTPQDAISFSPEAWWELNNITTGVEDSSGNGNDGTNNGAVEVPSGVAVIPSWKITDASGTANGVSTTLPSSALQQSDLQFDSPYSNYSLSFDGTGDYIDCGNDSVLTPANAISISLWVKTIDTRNFRGLIDKWNGTSSTGYMIDLGPSGANQGKARFSIGAQTSLSTTVTINDGDWHHVVVTCNNSIGFIYLDGLQNNTASLTLSDISNSDNLKIAGDNASTFHLDGKIDETAIWNTALTDAQILEIYNSGRPKDLSSFSGTAPTNWWRLGENAFFAGNVFTTPNSISGSPNGIGSGTVNTMISADAPGTYANGIGTNLHIEDRVGDAALSVANSQSYNMIPDDKVPYVPGYVGAQITNASEMAFNGADEYFDTGSNTIGQLQVMSASAWFKETQNASANTALVANNGSTNKGWAIWVDGAKIRWQVADGTGSVSWTETVLQNFRTFAPLNQWNHVCCTFDGYYSKIYINGVLRETWTATPTPYVVDYSGNVGNLTIARRSYSNSGFFRGQIDEVAIFDKALTADQVKFDLYEPTALVGGVKKTADIENNTNLPTPVAWYRM